MNKSYPIPFVPHLLEVFNLETISELSDAVNTIQEIRDQFLDYLVTICQLKLTDSPETGFYCFENFPNKNLHTYKYQEDGEVFDERIFKTFGDCLVCIEKLMNNKYYNPFLANLITRHSIDSKEKLVLELIKDTHLKNSVIYHLNNVKHIYTELKTYDGNYCLYNYPSIGKYSFVFQERGAISDTNDSFSSYEECLVFGLIGNSDLNRWLDFGEC